MLCGKNGLRGIIKCCECCDMVWGMSLMWWSIGDLRAATRASISRRAWMCVCLLNCYWVGERISMCL